MKVESGDKPRAPSRDHPVERAVEGLIFWSRWFQAPMYLGLVLGASIYSYKFMVELVHLCGNVNRLTEDAVMLGSSLKVKLVGSLIGISAIHLLKSFINLEQKPFDQIKWQIIIHVTFLGSAIALAICERILHPPHAAPHQDHAG